MNIPPIAELGFYHILDVAAWDHLLFVAALIAPFAPRDFKLWLAALTAFTLGHTLSMATQIALSFPLNERLVEGAVLATLVIHLAFYKLLRVPLPWGVLANYAW